MFLPNIFLKYFHELEKTISSKLKVKWSPNWTRRDNYVSKNWDCKKDRVNNSSSFGKDGGTLYQSSSYRLGLTFVTTYTISQFSIFVQCLTGLYFDRVCVHTTERESSGAWSVLNYIISCFLSLSPLVTAHVVSLFVSKKSFNLVVFNHTWNKFTWYHRK